MLELGLLILLPIPSKHSYYGGVCMCAGMLVDMPLKLCFLQTSSLLLPQITSITRDATPSPPTSAIAQTPLPRPQPHLPIANAPFRPPHKVQQARAYRGIISLLRLLVKRIELQLLVFRQPDVAQASGRIPDQGDAVGKELLVCWVGGGWVEA